MKIRSCVVLISSGILSCVVLASDSSIVSHHHLKFESSQTIHKLVGDHENVRVVLAAIPKTDIGSNEFKVTITRDTAEKRTYSLLTLGLQKVSYANEIRSGPPSARFTRIDDPEGKSIKTAEGEGFTLEATGLLSGPDADMPKIVDESKIWFVTLAEKVTVLTLKPILNRVVNTQWFDKDTKTYLTGHGVESP